MTTLAIDAATRSGLAVVRGGELLFAMNVNAPPLDRALEVIRMPESTVVGGTTRGRGFSPSVIGFGRHSG